MHEKPEATEALNDCSCLPYRFWLYFKVFELIGLEAIVSDVQCILLTLCSGDTCSAGN